MSTLLAAKRRLLQYMIEVSTIAEKASRTDRDVVQALLLVLRAAGVSQKDIAAALNINPVTVSIWGSGRAPRRPKEEGRARYALLDLLMLKIIALDEEIKGKG